MLSTTSINPSSSLILTYTLFMFYVYVHFVCYVDTAQFPLCLFQYRKAEGKHSLPNAYWTPRAVIRSKGSTGHAATPLLDSNDAGTILADTLTYVGMQSPSHASTHPSTEDGGKYNTGNGSWIVRIAVLLCFLIDELMVTEHRPVSSRLRETPTLVQNSDLIQDETSIKHILNTSSLIDNPFQVFSICAQFQTYSMRELIHQYNDIIYVGGVGLLFLIVLCHSCFTCTLDPIHSNVIGCMQYEPISEWQCLDEMRWLSLLTRNVQLMLCANLTCYGVKWDIIVHST